MKTGLLSGLVVLAVTAAPAAAQHAWGLDGLLSSQRSNAVRQENAFGLGGTYTLDFVSLVNSLTNYNLQLPVRFKAYFALDMEIVAGELNPGFYRAPDPVTGEFNFYKNGSDQSVDPSVAEAPATVQGFWAIAPVVDAWRIRLGFSFLNGHFGSGDKLNTWLVGFALTPRSWAIVELPDQGGFRLRIEGSIWSEPLLTF